MATAMVEEGSDHAKALQSAIQTRLIEINWAPEENDTTLSDYITMMLVHGKDENAVKSELAGDLLGIGEEDQMVPEFTNWLFSTAAALHPSNAASAGGHEADEATQDAQMDDAGVSAPVDGAPSGPKAMRNGRGRGGRTLGQINRHMDRSDPLSRIKGAAGGNGGRINSHAGRDGGRGSRNQNLANGVQRMMNGRNHGPGNQMPMPGAMMNPVDAQNQQMMFMQMFEMQAQMLQQLAQNQQPKGGPGAFKHGRGGKGMFDKRGQNKLNNKEGDDESMSLDGGAKKPLFDTMCRFNDKCTNPDCGFAHQSPAITKPGTIVDMQDTCKFGAKCTNFKCSGRHPSPCLSEQWQQRQKPFGAPKYQEQTLCRFYPNCTRGDQCPYIHSDSAQTSITCRYTPCTRPNCTFIHAEGQQQAPGSNVWTADGNNAASMRKTDRFAGFKENEDQPEELIRPHTDATAMDTQDAQIPS